MNIVVVLFDSSRPPKDMAVIEGWLAERSAAGDSCHVVELRGVARSSVEVDGVTYHRGSAYAPQVVAVAEVVVVTHSEGFALVPEGAEVRDATGGFDAPAKPSPGRKAKQ